MKIKYFNQEHSANFSILDRINVIYSDVGNKPRFQIKPFRVKYGDKIYSFPGLVNNAWKPIKDCCILGEVNDDSFYLTAVYADMVNSKIESSDTVLGIFMHVGKDEITVLNHVIEEVTNGSNTSN